jgi:hypothetical protein
VNHDKPWNLGLGVAHPYQQPKGWFTWKGAPIPDLTTDTEHITKVFRHQGTIVGFAREFLGMIDSGLHVLAIDEASGAVLDDLQLYWLMGLDDEAYLDRGGGRWSIYFGNFYEVQLTPAPCIDVMTWALGFFRGSEKLTDILRPRRLIVRRDHARQATHRWGE